MMCRLTQELIEEALELVIHDDPAGICTVCGEVVHGVEDNAREYTCPQCGHDAVYGVDEIVSEAGV